jgi:hypothetical protein
MAHRLRASVGSVDLTTVQEGTFNSIKMGLGLIGVSVDDSSVPWSLTFSHLPDELLPLTPDLIQFCETQEIDPSGKTYREFATLQLGRIRMHLEPEGAVA